MMTRRVCTSTLLSLAVLLSGAACRPGTAKVALQNTDELTRSAALSRPRVQALQRSLAGQRLLGQADQIAGAAPYAEDANRPVVKDAFRDITVDVLCDALDGDLPESEEEFAEYAVEKFGGLAFEGDSESWLYDRVWDARKALRSGQAEQYRDACRNLP